MPQRFEDTKKSQRCYVKIAYVHLIHNSLLTRCHKSQQILSYTSTANILNADL